LLEDFRAISPTLGCQRPCDDAIGKIHNHALNAFFFLNQAVSISSVWRSLHQQKHTESYMMQHYSTVSQSQTGPHRSLFWPLENNISRTELR